MMKYRVSVGYSDEFVFRDGDEAIAFANTAVTHLEKDKVVRIEISNVADEDKEESEEN